MALMKLMTKTDKILVKQDEIVEEMSKEDIIKFYKDKKKLFTSEEIVYYCDINHEEWVSRTCEFLKTKKKSWSEKKGQLKKYQEDRCPISTL